MLSLFLTLAVAQVVMKHESYQMAFIEATSCPSQMMQVQKVTSKDNCIVTSRYVDDECMTIKKKVICKRVHECRIFLECMGPK